MKILVTGSGGREHAMIDALLRNPRVERIFCAPGNGGTAGIGRCENIPLTDPRELADFAAEEGVGLALPGSEDLLVEGIADLFREKGILVLGPGKDAARLEGSKCFSKDFMTKYGIKTASYRNFTAFEEADAWLDQCPYPTVLKADGLAAGKGVLICRDRAEAKASLRDLMISKQFGEAGTRIVIEEYLQGWEASILSFYDGETILPLVSAKDHKKIGENETGPNTGGMGVVCPNPHMSADHMEAFVRDIMNPTLQGLRRENLTFSGVIFFGLMITPKGTYLLEYNLRLGDPETQAVLNLLESDFLELVQASVEKRLSGASPRWKGGASCCVVMASGGYPGDYGKGMEITGIGDADCPVYIAGAVRDGEALRTSGGRVLNVVGVGQTMDEARKIAYRNVERIEFSGKIYRRDIGGGAL